MAAGGIACQVLRVRLHNDVATFRTRRVLDLEGLHLDVVVQVPERVLALLACGSNLGCGRP